MADDADAPVLGKRSREANPNGDDEPMEDRNPSAGDEDSDSDDDVGPMPMPASAQAAATRKKRKGTYLSCIYTSNYIDSLQTLFVVLPHEKTYLEHLPDSQQYYKSFMHRDVVNFVVFTKYVFQYAYSLYFPIVCVLTRLIAPGRSS